MHLTVYTFYFMQQHFSEMALPCAIWHITRDKSEYGSRGKSICLLLCWHCLLEDLSIYIDILVKSSFQYKKSAATRHYSVPAHSFRSFRIFPETRKKKHCEDFLNFLITIESYSRMWSLNVLMLVLCAASSLADTEEPVSASIELNENNFVQETDDRNVLVLFYSPGYVSNFHNIYF